MDSKLLIQLAYGAGLRVSELVRLRVKDLDFANHLVIVRAAKGNKDRGTLLPRKLDVPLQDQIRHVRGLHDQDLAAGHGAVYLPFTLDRKYPAAPKEFGWREWRNRPSRWWSTGRRWREELPRIAPAPTIPPPVIEPAPPPEPVAVPQPTVVPVTVPEPEVVTVTAPVAIPEPVPAPLPVVVIPAPPPVMEPVVLPPVLPEPTPVVIAEEGSAKAVPITPEVPVDSITSSAGSSRPP